MVNDQATCFLMDLIHSMIAKRGTGSVEKAYEDFSNKN